jgi:uncharacterized protein
LDPNILALGGLQLNAKPVELLILQASPFCNIDCDYCYLADRSNRDRISHSTIAETCKGLRDANLVAESIAVQWHAGEPLVIPVEFYDEAHRIIQEIFKSYQVEFAIQTNGTLIDKSWIDFFRRWNVQIGISCDGPEPFHDANRKTRKGGGTHARVHRAMLAVKDAGLPLRIICVLTPKSILCADTLFEYFEEIGADSVGFNCEEREGVNFRPSFEKETCKEHFLNFFIRYFTRVISTGSKQNVRELRHAQRYIFLTDHSQRNLEVDPIRILTVGADGSVSTFSPELLGVIHPVFGKLVFANVKDQSWVTGLLQNEGLRQVSASIQRGVEVCRESCAYFDICYGGSPSNKLAEWGTFEGSETITCMFRKQAVAEAITRVISATVLGL